MRRGLLFGVIGALLLGLIVVLILRSRQPSAPSAVTIKLWSPFDEGKTYQAMAASFLANNPNVKLDFHYIQAVDAKDYEAKVVNAIASANGPDIWLIRTDWLPKHQTKLYPQPTSVSFANHSQTNAEGLVTLLSEAGVNQNSRDGKLYGLPLSVDSLALYVNRNVFNQVSREHGNDTAFDSSSFNAVPKTWTDVANKSQLITKKDSKGTIIRSGLALGTVSNTYAATDVFDALLAQFGGSFYAPNEQDIVLNLAQTQAGTQVIPGKQALDLFTSFALKNSPNYSWNNSLGDPVQAFINDKVGMLIGYSSVTTQLIQEKKDLSTITVVPLPQLKEQLLPSDTRTDYATYWTQVVNKTSSAPVTAWRLLQALETSQSLRLYQQQTLKPTVNLIDPSVKPSANTADDNTVFVAQIPTSVTAFKPEWQFIDSNTQNLISQVVDLGQSSQEAIDSIAETLKKGPQ